ncbi:MAG: DUF4399 domain-containing protein [Myxococcota bacterium]
MSFLRGSILSVLFGSFAFAGAVHAEHHEVARTARPADAKLYFISPEAGATVKNPVVVRFGLAGMGVAPAGVPSPNTGHHHLVIDAELPAPGAPVPADANHVHFGKGQTETSLELAPGEHTLQLLLGDHGHVPHDPPLASERITITVAE